MEAIATAPPATPAHPALPASTPVSDPPKQALPDIGSMVVPEGAPSIGTMVPTPVLGFIRANPLLPETRGYIRRHLHIVLPEEVQVHLGTGDNILRWAIIEWCKVNQLPRAAASPPTPGPTVPPTLRVNVNMIRTTVEQVRRQEIFHDYEIEVPRSVALNGKDAVIGWINDCLEGAIHPDDDAEPDDEVRDIMRTDTMTTELSGEDNIYSVLQRAGINPYPDGDPDDDPDGGEEE